MNNIHSIDEIRNIIADYLKYYFNLPALPVYANNAAAVAGGLTVGKLYRTGGDPDTVCIVH
jgi:hypothetical protein